MNQKEALGKIGIIIIICAVIIGLIALTGFETVPAGHVGVLSTFGDVEDNEMMPGFAWVGMFTDAIPFSTQVQKATYQANAASKDLQAVSANVAVNFKVPGEKASDIYKTIGKNYQDIVIEPVVQEAVKASTAKYTAEDLVKTRESVKQDITTYIIDRLQKSFITVTEVSITNFDFSPEFNKAIEAKQVAEQLALQAENELARIKVEKEQTITRAEAEAQSTKNKAEAEAYALKVVREELEKSKDLIEYKRVEKWNGVLPTIVTGDSGLLFNINPQTGAQ